MRKGVVLLAVLLLTAAVEGFGQEWGWTKGRVRQATWVVGSGVCTALAIDPTHILTASHCVPAVDGTVQVTDVVEGGLGTQEAVVAFDSVTEDVAFLRIPVPTPNHIGRFPTCPVHEVGKKLWAYTISLGLVGWESTLEYVGRYFEFGRRWVVAYTGNAYPGASGSVVFDVDRGCAVSNITHGSAHGFPVVILGTSSELILSAYNRMLGGQTK